ncbi:MAG TPA: hypothetical protein VHZ97_00320 [Pseudonocardiaceae bacterium]|nr:hypothetical protein [Pseudonocardiaceae bacterium]
MAEDNMNGADPAGVAITTAGAGLQGVSAGVSGIAQAVASGSLTLSQETASALLGTIGQLQDQANDLISVADTIDKPLHFGHNWVGLTMDSKLRAVAAGQDSSIRPVLVEFANLLGQVEATIARAAQLTVDNDEAQRQLLTKAGETQ